MELTCTSIHVDSATLHEILMVLSCPLPCNQVTLGIPGGDALRELATGTIPLGRIGTAEEAAGAILMLASPWSSYITGQVLEVNGGSYM